MHRLILHHVGYIHKRLFFLLGHFYSILTNNRSLLFSQGKNFRSDTLIQFQNLTSHQILMWNTATNIIDNLLSISIEMSILISIFLSNILRWKIQLTNIRTSNISKFLNKFRQYLFQQLFLILMFGNHILKLLDLIPSLLIFLLFLFLT